MGWMNDLGRGPVGVDAAIFIYFIEEHPTFLPLVEPLFREADGGRRELVTSALTLLEVLVVPYRSGDHLLAARYEAILTRSRGITVADISGDHLRAAAQLRAATGVKTPDSLQLVAALAAKCRTFLTNDRALPTLPGMRILQLDSYIRA
jgi:predicted nucleic acid-binding protein